MRFLRPVVVVELVGTNKIPDHFLLFFFFRTRGISIRRVIIITRDNRLAVVQTIDGGSPRVFRAIKITTKCYPIKRYRVGRNLRVYNLLASI